jgi:hypothetical protein
MIAAPVGNPFAFPNLSMHGNAPQQFDSRRPARQLPMGSFHISAASEWRKHGSRSPGNQTNRRSDDVDDGVVPPTSWK